MGNKSHYILERRLLWRFVLDTLKPEKFQIRPELSNGRCPRGVITIIPLILMLFLITEEY